MAVQTFIDDLYPGDDWRPVWLVPGVPTGDAVDAAEWVIKDNAFVLDADALLSKSITSTLDPAQGVIPDDGSTTQIAQLNFSASSVETAALRAGRSYYYKVRVHLSFADIWQTAESGQFIPAV